ncbi:death-on-curing protein [Candidatus Methylomirabilis lanthanidiphila]|uniref:Death-on-curing protein n=1 Tax=Candidatus Methylomirabilis lanthanidiphila TaxID=2211376 RepID=A0A564ZIT1_9BACT|nr:type II toxin-antitoxin system death-on-curing family toxin [Candidatus Methylomirabilis lanthanidiphila]VUZ84797.1 death-on-curing protein [Candidatus Methylomirabilis lanthanidiphila]
MSPVFLSLDEVIEIHRDMIERYGGSAGIRDMGLLQSAVAMPQTGFGGEFLHADLFEMAAAYLFHIIQNHPFIDGNKRVGSMTAFAFLKLNGLTLAASETDFEQVVLEVARGRLNKAAIAEFLRTHSRR